jgi:hypothetical protein
MFANGDVPDSICSLVNCSPKTDIYLDGINSCGNGTSYVYVMDSCESGNVVIYAPIEQGATCVGLTSGAAPLPAGTYFVVVDGGSDGRVLDYQIRVEETYSLGLGGDPCSKDAITINSASVKQQSLQSLSNIQLHPVPASNELTITFNTNSAEKNVRISVLDMAGKQVLPTQQVAVSNGVNVHTLNVSNLNNGVYLLSVVNNGERVVSRFSIAK